MKTSAMEKLIRAVRKHECLWNLSDKDYRNPEKKDMAWQSIVDLKLDVRGLRDIKTVKMEWKKLRDNHRDSLKRAKSKSTHVNPWRFAQDMEFLVPYMKSRERYSKSDYDDETVNDTNQPCSPATMFLQPSTYDSDEEEDSKISVQNQITSFSRKRMADSDNFKEVDISFQNNEKHPIEYFFDSMAQTAKVMPIYLQNKIKKGVLEIVCQAEEEMEVYKTNGGLP